MAFFIIYTNILIQNAKRDAQFVPQIFARYIAYTDAYLKIAEKNSQLVPHLIASYINFLPRDNFDELMSGYVRDEFIPQVNYPLIVTDQERSPQYWRNIGVDERLHFNQLPPGEQVRVLNLLKIMDEIPMVYNEKTLGYVYYAHPISLRDFLKHIEYPIIVTDKAKIPLFWRNVGISENVPYTDLPLQEQTKLSNVAMQMYEIPMKNNGRDVGYVYFNESPSLQNIRLMTYLEVILIMMFVIFGLYGLAMIKKTEKDSLWVALAKETAHQFGTPITSLLGWIDFLRLKMESQGLGEDSLQMLDYMQTDVERLRNVASRFGKVGSSVQFKPAELHAIVEETIQYFQNRLPHLGNKIELTFISKIQGLMVNIDADLIKWTLENLLKNCIDAMSQKGGNIIITATSRNHVISLQIRDEGKGMPKSMFKKIFEPGVTTKSRGWGLGLSLAKRIIEDYHKGKIRVIDSTVGEGTTFEIVLKEEK